MSQPQEWELRPGPGGMGILWKGKTLTSSYRPEEDAKRRADSLPDADLYVVLGWGSGHFIHSLAERKSAVVLAWEPHSGRSLASRAYPGWTENHPRVLWWQGVEPPYETFLCFNPDSIKIVVHPGLEEEPEILLAKAQSGNILDRLAVNHRTLRRFAALWGRNAAANIKLSKTESLEAWRGWAKGVTAFIAAAGPSLEASLDWLAGKRRDQPHKFLLIAVDTAFEALSAHGIIPDFLVCMDAQYWNSRHLDTPIPAETILVSELVASPAVLRRHKGRVVLAGSSIPLVQDVENGVLPRLASGGSVATAAAALAGFLGCRSLVWLGLDLCFYGYRTHARPGLVHRLRERWSDRTRSMATLAAESLFNNPLVRLQVAKRTLIADQRMPLYAAWLTDACAEGLVPEGIRVGTGWPVGGYEVIPHPENLEGGFQVSLPPPPAPNYLCVRNTGRPGRNNTNQNWIFPAENRMRRWPCPAAEKEYQHRREIVNAFFRLQGDSDDRS